MNDCSYIVLYNGGDMMNESSSHILQKETVLLSGLHCGDCAAKVEKVIGRMQGVEHCEVNYATSKMKVSYDSLKVEQENIFDQIQKLGYQVDPSTYQGNDISTNNNLPSMEASFWRGNSKVKITWITGILFLSAWFLSFTPLVTDPILNVIYAAAIGIGGYPIARRGWYALKSRAIGMELLMTIAAIGAGAIGEWGEGAAIVFLFSLGETLEAYTMDKTRKSIRSLMDLAPKEALIRRNGTETIVPVADIRVGDTMIVKPGEKIAMDGQITKGVSTVNQAPITGESIPVEKLSGDGVFAGSINQQGALEVEVTKLAKDNTISRIIEMVEEAQSQKAPSQRFVDRFSRYYTPAVIIAAILIATLPPLILADAFAPWFYRALTMLVVACPCALVISTPVAIISAIGNAARNGVLIKGGAYLERLGAIKAIAFDKTGTLTKGIPQVTGVKSFVENMSEDQVLQLATAIETRSEHPIAKAIVQYGTMKNVEPLHADQFYSIIGKGAQAEIQNQVYFIGNPRLFEEMPDVDIVQWVEEIKALQSRGNTVMLLGTETRLLGMISVADQIRENSARTIHSLRKMGIERTYMLTGDNEGTARGIAEQIGDIDYLAERLPEDKVTAVKDLMKDHQTVAMVGDGINDAPALATSTVGIAMGAAGTDTALETADIALMADDLSKIPYTVKLSRRTLRIIKQNITFSLLVKAVFLAMIIPGWATLWMAVIADTGSSLLVILNGMRLLRSNKDE
jgi:Cd2+/Zn2+-exporting ATPase